MYFYLFFILLLFSHESFSTTSELLQQAENSPTANVECIVQEKKLCSLVQNIHDIRGISDQIWGKLLGSEFTRKIDEFKSEHHIAFKILRTGISWTQQKKDLDTKMVEKIPGTSYSWEKFRDIDRSFKEELINKALPIFKLNPISWMTSGTVGYLSDIDNVAVGTQPDQELIAKILFDTLNYHMYGVSSNVSFDEEAYTQQPGAILKTRDVLETKEGIEKYEKISLSLSQLQILRNIKHSNIMKWSEYKHIFVKIFQDIEEVLESVEKFESILTAAIDEDEKTLSRIYSKAAPVKKEELMDLVNLKAVLLLSYQIQQYSTRISKITASVEAIRDIISKEKSPALSEASKELIDSSTKEKDDISVQKALLFASQGTYFPESYYSQEAFQLVVGSDSPQSQILSMMADRFVKEHAPTGMTMQQVRNKIIAENKNTFVHANPFIHIISMGEQIGYFLHKVDSPKPFPYLNLLKGAKYLDRYVLSFSFLLSYFHEHMDEYAAIQNFPEITDSYSTELQEAASTLLPFYRGKIYTSTNAVRAHIQDLISKENPSIDKDTRTIVSSTIMNKIDNILVTQAFSNSEKQNKLLHIFDPENEDNSRTTKIYASLRKSAGLQSKEYGIFSKNKETSLILNSLLGKARHENADVKDQFNEKLQQAFVDLNLDTNEKAEFFIKKLLVNYMNMVRIFFSGEKNKFDPYSINYNEINLRHTFSPRNLIPD